MVVSTSGLNGVNGKSPLSPTIPHKPSNLSLSMKPSRSPLNASLPLSTNGNITTNGGLPTTNGVGVDAKEKVDALAHVKNAADPRELIELTQKGVKILFLDVRTREEFNRGKVRGQPVVCVEPSVLAREKCVPSLSSISILFSMVGLVLMIYKTTKLQNKKKLDLCFVFCVCSVTSQTIESSLSIAPREELMLFTNRDKFDLVVIYDSSSTTLGSLASHSPLSVVVKAIYETEFRKILKQVPVLMLGGYEAYKREIGSGAGAGAGAGGGEGSNEVPTLSLSMNNFNMNANPPPPPPLALASQPISPTTSTPPSLPSIHEGFQSQSSTPPVPSSSSTNNGNSNSNRASPLSSASTGRTRAGTESLTYGSSASASGPGSGGGQHSRDAASSGYTYADRRSLDQMSMPGSSTSTGPALARKPALSRPPSVTSFSRSISDNVSLFRVPPFFHGFCVRSVCL